MQGFYGDPRHGGNREGVSWKMLAFRIRRFAAGFATTLENPRSGAMSRAKQPRRRRSGSWEGHDFSRAVTDEEEYVAPEAPAIDVIGCLLSM